MTAEQERLMKESLGHLREARRCIERGERLPSLLAVKDAEESLLAMERALLFDETAATVVETQP